MKIVIFIENNQNGGLDTFCSTLINHWPEPKDSFVVICNASHPGRNNLERSIEGQCTFVCHNIPLSWVVSQNLLFFLPSFIRRVSQPFFRIFFLPFQNYLIKKIFEVHKGDELIVVNGGFPGGESCRIANIVWSDMGRKPGIHNFHNFAVTPRLGFGWYENWMDKKLIEATKLFISVSRSCSESIYVRKMFSEVSHNRFIYNGIASQKALNVNHLNLRKELDIGNDPICLMLGNYEPRKGHKFIFEAFQQVVKSVPNAHLVICGGGTTSEIIKVRDLKSEIIPINNVHLLGFIPDGASLINQADLLLIGSQEYESFGLTAVEAMIRSKPVIATDIGGLPEVIGRDGKCGFIVNHQDVTVYADKVVLLLNDESLQESMGLYGKNRVLELFTAERMSKEYLNALSEGAG